jgi:hypothetical protein
MRCIQYNLNSVDTSQEKKGNKIEDRSSLASSHLFKSLITTVKNNDGPSEDTFHVELY